MTNAEIRQYMDAWGMGAGVGTVHDDIQEARYDLPTQDWFLGNLAKDIRDSLERHKVAGYTVNAWDCSMFADHGRLVARMAHYQQLQREALASGNALRQTAIAVGEVRFYWMQEYVYHRTLFAIMDRNKPPIFQDPQPAGLGSIFTLKEDEIASITHRRI